VKALEEEVTELEAQKAAQNQVKYYVDMFSPFAGSVITALGGEKTTLGRAALAGLSGAGPDGEQQEAATDDDQTSMVMNLVRHFMTTLSGQHRQKLLSLMMSIQRDPTLITRIHQSIHQPKPAQQAAAPKQAIQDEQQPKA
jgi:hypothetical protein